ncbi:DUF2231 domain-containing protein [Salinimicrobium terrae]|uniref:DUF2231 domain-containing protein n=1 Tax=Salinimicrobium terrae TaxID=470866 RepID=UPI001B7FA7E7|nr:DUF2231 domain-containing protein [Salinimicrobium terrae]
MRTFLSTKTALFTLLLFFSPGILPIHASDGFQKNRTDSVHWITINSVSTASLALELALLNETDAQEDIAAPFDAFPNLHMLFVHFPVVLLIVAFLFQILTFFLYKEGMDVATLIVLGLGWLGALLAAYVFHPHVADLPEQTQKIFEAHEFYAYWTVGLSSVALALKGVAFFFFRGKRWMEWLILITLIATVFVISKAGHLGSQLVYIEGVGPQGKYLKQEHSGGHQH